MTRCHTGMAGALLAATMSIGLAAAPAHAAPLRMSSHIDNYPRGLSHDGYYDEQVINIQGVVTMSQAAAQDSINHGYTIALRYWGDDTDSDDLLYGPVAPGNVFAAADGLHFQNTVVLTHAQLDEDNGYFEDFADAGKDEIYVGARLLDALGLTVDSVESNRIERQF
jgi:hypothetical protein